MAPLSSINTAAVALLVLLNAPSSTNAFGVITPHRSSSLSFNNVVLNRPRSLILYNDSGENEDVAAAASEEEEQAETSVEGEVVAEEEEEPKEDPELKAMKDEIAELESALKQKNRDLNSIESMVDKFSKAGYARKVAELDQLRKNRRATSQNNQYTERANVLQKFLPVLDELTELDAKYGGEGIAASYSALKGSLIGGMKELKAAEFSVESGEKIDSRRVTTVEEIYSEDIEKGCVVEMKKAGWELEGNVMRFAEAVASLGSEADAQKAEEAAAAEESEATTEEESEE